MKFLILAICVSLLVGCEKVPATEDSGSSSTNATSSVSSSSVKATGNFKLEKTTGELTIIENQSSVFYLNVAEKTSSSSTFSWSVTGSGNGSVSPKTGVSTTYTPPSSITSEKTVTVVCTESPSGKTAECKITLKKE